jgi:hypothetical protein
VEVDLLCETEHGFVAIEMKAASRWDKSFNRGLNRMREELGRDRVTCFGVYRGSHSASWDGILILPVMDFLKRLWDGTVLR